MRTVLICNQKGGVGKSLIADEVAFFFERAQIPLAFLDLDNQGGTLHKTHKNVSAEVMIIDTPGALQEGLKDWITEADVVIIPTRATQRDIAPLQRMQRIVSQRPDLPVLYVLNGWNRWRAAQDFLEGFRQSLGPPPLRILTLPQSEHFVQAGAMGQSVVDYARNSSAAQATLNLCEQVFQILFQRKGGDL